MSFSVFGKCFLGFCLLESDRQKLEKLFPKIAKSDSLEPNFQIIGFHGG